MVARCGGAGRPGTVPRRIRRSAARPEGVSGRGGGGSGARRPDAPESAARRPAEPAYTRMRVTTALHSAAAYSRGSATAWQPAQRCTRVRYSALRGIVADPGRVSARTSGAQGAQARVCRARLALRGGELGRWSRGSRPGSSRRGSFCTPARPPTDTHRSWRRGRSRDSSAATVGPRAPSTRSGSRGRRGRREWPRPLCRCRRCGRTPISAPPPFRP